MRGVPARDITCVGGEVQREARGPREQGATVREAGGAVRCVTAALGTGCLVAS